MKRIGHESFISNGWSPHGESFKLHLDGSPKLGNLLKTNWIILVEPQIWRGLWQSPKIFWDHFGTTDLGPCLVIFIIQFSGSQEFGAIPF